MHSHTHSLALFTKGDSSSDIPIAPRSWFINITPSLEGNRAPWSNGWYLGGERKLQDEPGKSYCARNQRSAQEGWVMSKRHRSQLHAAPASQTGDNVNMKII